MRDNTNNRILEIAEISVLVTLLFIRLFIKSDQNNWISLLNFAGFIIAYVSLYASIYRSCSTYKKIDIVTGVFIILLVLQMIIAGLILSEVLILSTKCNDIILILTLLITLPTKLLSNLIANLIKN